MIYPVIVALTMFVLPIASMAVEASFGVPNWLWLIGKWFVFWAVGVRLLLAGVRQYVQPAFTTRDIMGIDSPEAFIIVRELGGANAAAGVVGLMSILFPTFVLPSAIASGVFYAVAGWEHVKSTHRGRNETIAMVSDIFIALVLLGFAVGAFATGLR